MRIIECNDLSKDYRNIKALDHITLSVERGEIYGLIGRNGAGKTTLLRLIAGTLKKSSGNVVIGEQSFNDCRKQIGSMIDGTAFYPQLSGFQNMEILARLIDASKEEIDNLLDLVGLSAAKDRKVREYSLGMKQRLGLAIALMGNPEIVLLDEPFNGLDPVGMRDIRDLLIKLNKENGITFVISSHMLSELHKLVDTYGFIERGRLLDVFDHNEKNIDELETYFFEKAGA